MPRMHSHHMRQSLLKHIWKKIDDTSSGKYEALAFTNVQIGYLRMFGVDMTHHCLDVLDPYVELSADRSQGRHANASLVCSTNSPFGPYGHTGPYLTWRGCRTAHLNALPRIASSSRLAVLSLESRVCRVATANGCFE